MKRVLLYITLISLACAAQAQPLTLLYQLKPAAANTTMDTLVIALRNNTAATIDLGAVNFSVAYQGSCAGLSVGTSNFNTTWGSTMELAADQPIALAYEYIIYVNGTAKPSGVIDYDQRWQYGNTNAASATPTPVSLAPATNGIEVMQVLVDLQATCTGEVYLESIVENPANEISDQQGNLLAYAIERVDDVLPVEWMDFQAYQTGEYSATLDWATATEINNAKFEVEKSLDGMIFERIGEVSGQGTTNNITTYDFVDTKVFEKVNYYRLKQVDFNGDFSYSEIREVRMNSNGSFTIDLYPNPATDQLQISASLDRGRDFQLIVVDMAGRIMYQANQVSIGGTQIQKLDVSKYAPGVYMVRIQEQNDNQYHSQSFVKK